jgi:polyisoprenoid-binding protein YceI
MHAPWGQADASLQPLLEKGSLAGEWVLDSRASSIRLKSKAIGVIGVSGSFRDVTGTGTVSEDGTVSGSIEIAAASIDTKNPRRDAHLRSADFFGSDGNRYITFTLHSIRLPGPGAAVAGLLNIRGNARPLSFDSAASVRDDSEIWLDAEVRVNRGDFGMTWNPLGLISMTSIVTVHAVFTRR